MLTVARPFVRLIAADALRVASRLLDRVAAFVDPEPEDLGIPVDRPDDPLAGARTMIAPPPRSDTMPSPSNDEEPLVGSLEARGLAGSKRSSPWR